MRLRHAFIALAVLLQAAHCQSSGAGGPAADGSMAGDLSLPGSADLASGPEDGGGDAGGTGGGDAGGGTKLRSCVKGCIGVGDCSLGSAAFDADNYSCTAGACVYKGCNNDSECKSSFSDTTYVCRPVAGVPTCGKGCMTAADCNLGSAAFDADNYNCTAGFCEYKGCNNDNECKSSFANTTYVCRNISGVPTCGKGCTTPADCNSGSAAFDVDNYNCTAGVCDYKGCNDDNECKSSFANPDYLCR